MKTPIRAAFTLVELLVVITIIVILLSLLTPALDRAIYQAEIAVCGANQKGIATGAIAYAAGNGRKYPYRPTIAGGGWQRPNAVCQPGLDDRPYLRPYMALKILLDPFAGKFDLEQCLPSSSGFSNYELWFGMRFRDQPGSEGLMKIGDRLSWAETSTPPALHRFNVLVSCEEKWVANNLDAHPDEEGRTRFTFAQDTATSDGYGTGQAMLDGTYTISRWVGTQRGALDVNYTFDDGAVRRYDGVAHDVEERMEKVPWTATGATTVTQWTHLPLK